MIADSHCHAWRRWPYEPRVPDPDTRGSVETLLHELDVNGVDRAAVVCARIGAAEFANVDNNAYVAMAARRHADRLVAFVDIDSTWRPEHHTPGAARRLVREVERYAATGFTHYLGSENDGWLRSDEGFAMFAAAAERDLVASISASPPWFDDLAELAHSFPTMPILLHHLGWVRARGPGAVDARALLRLAGSPNVLVKVSGFHYLTEHAWAFPYPAAAQIVRDLHSRLGASRLCWGSDFPAARDKQTYRQSMEAVRSGCDFITPSDLDAVMGETLDAVLRTRRPPR